MCINFGKKKGFILILTLIFMMVLTIMASAMIYMINYQTRSTAPLLADAALESLADAGIERAHRVVRDDYVTTTATGVADLRGADTSLSISISTQDNMRYIDTSNATINSNTDQAILRTFDSNYANTRIVSVYLVYRVSASGNGASVQAAYTLNGTAYTALTAQAITTTMTEYSANITNANTQNWANLMSSNFRLRLMRTASTRTINIDALFLRVTYTIDTLKEPWATGSYATFPISLGGGKIESITVTDEAGKVHLNYASQALLTNLLTNLSIASASTKATAIVTYRGASLTNPFDSVEELQLVPGITAGDYTAIKDYVTAYSFENPYSYRLTAIRAPININTASSIVLKSVFDSLGLGAGDAQSLANDIITFRTSTPFTCFYSSQAAVTTDFNHFVTSRSYLIAAEQNIVLDNCDPSNLIPISGYAGYNCSTTELCYAGYAFTIDCLASYQGRNLRVKTIRGNDGSHTFATYTTEPAPYPGWRKENYE